MMLDEATIEQVLSCLKIEPLEEIVNIPWNEWARKEALLAYRRQRERERSLKRAARMQRERLKAQRAAREAAAEAKKKKKKD
eukprot:SAG31_NODE_45390_length_259_cov_0.637500_1_plen_81_part_10